MLCVIATDDGVHLMSRHFGDAVQYDLYFLSEKEIVLQETIVNPFCEDEEEDDEDVHGGKVKAGNMKELFLERGVRVLVSKRFGPNIKRMVRNFVPVVIRRDDIESSKELLIRHFRQIEEMFGMGQDRKSIILG